VEAKKMVERDDDGGRGGSEDGARCQCNTWFGKRALTRRRFVKTSAAVGAAVAGIPPYNLTDIADLILSEEGELMLYPAIDEYDLELVHDPFRKHIIGVHLWGCNWNCRWCPIKFSNLKETSPRAISIDQLTDLLLDFSNDTETMLAIAGGEPLIQREEVLKLIDSLKTRTDYTVMLVTNGSLIDEDFITKANDVELDRVNISFRHLDDEWHKWYTGHSNQRTIDALKLASNQFEGLTAVSLIPFSCIDTATFKDICEFLYGINPDFGIKIFCPRHEREECEERFHELEGIALQYFKRVDRRASFSTQLKFIRYQIEEENGRIQLVKSWESKREKVAEGNG
jgi:pyruvate-formate lyase-activating enzyme